MDCDCTCDEIRECNEESTAKIKKSKRISNKVMKDSKAMAYLSPLEYIKQVSANPEKLICDCTNCDEMNSSIFSANPKIIVFRKFKVGNVYNATIHVRNISKVPHHLRLQCSENVNFNVIFRGSTCNPRLAAGMAHVYEVEFQPDEQRDYVHDIVFTTDEGMFVVPVIAAGPRALLSFPDQIDMGRTAVKFKKIKPILLQNVGDICTSFSFFTDNPCYEVKPSKGLIKVRTPVQIQIQFTPKQVGIVNGHLFLKYNSDDTVQSLIYGESISCDVQVAKTNIAMEDTYLGLSRTAYIEIQNNSDCLLHYEWVKYANDEEENQGSKKREQEDLSSDYMIPLNQHELACKIIYTDKIESFIQESFLFENEHFRLCPMKGEAWPRSSTKVTVTFEPKEVGDISTVAYLEISGREERFAIRLTGKCIGPTLELNFLSLDVRDIHLCATYSYEVVCKNSGPIPGTLVFKPKCSCFGCTITVEPSETKVDVGEMKLLRLSICSDRTGDFIERVDFIIKESSEICSMVIKGTVIPALVRTDTEEMRFDPVALGFTMKKQLCFRNISHLPVEFRINVPSDGYEAAVTHEEFARAQIKPRLPPYPCEFSIYPREGTVTPQSCLSVQISYTPNIERSGNDRIEVYMCNSSNAEPLLVPFSFNAKTATYTVIPAEVNIRFCYVNYPYVRNLTITNTSDVEGYFYIIPQEVHDDTVVLYSLLTYQRYLEAGQSTEITLTIIVKEIGHHESDLNLFSLGFDAPIRCCEIVCNGQGPVVSVEMSSLDFGEVKLLERKFRILDVINESPISAQFTTSVSKNASVWDIRPSSGEVEANEIVSLKVSVFLRDTGKYVDKLSIAILNGKTINVNLSAIGVGTCIVFNPEIFPVFDMGFLFRCQDTTIPIVVRNEGTRYHYVLLTNVEKIRQAKKASVEEIENSKFKIEPNILELLPGSMQTIHCKIRWNVNETVTEQWYVNATIDGQGKRELLGTSTFIATFVEPNVIFSKSEVSFRLDFGWNCQTLQQEDELQVTNQSGRNLSAHFTIEPPFLMIEKCNCYTDNLDLILFNNKQTIINVHFPFNVENVEPAPRRYQGYLKIKYDEHKYTDEILCKAEVNFPHLIFTPNEVTWYCVAGWTVEERVELINDSPLLACYKIRWIKESFSYESLTPITEHGSEGSVSRKSYSDDKYVLIEADEFSDLYPMLSACECEEGICTHSSSGDSKCEIASIDLVDKFLQFSPQEGQLLPHSKQYISFVFNGFECAKISVQAICEIVGGLPQIFNITAIADTVRCEIQDYILDYGLQLFCDPSVATLKVYNQCRILLNWNIESSSNLLRVIEGPEMLNPSSESLISIERRPSAPGIYSEKLFLEITHLEPFIIEVRWLATIPQIYLDVPRTAIFEKYPVEFGYQAVQAVMAECTIQEHNFLDLKCSSISTINEETYISEYERIQLLDDDWKIIEKDGNYPKQIDIDMAFERVIAKDFIETIENISSVSNFDGNDNQRITLPLGPSYLIDMGFVVVEQVAQLFIELRNYGYEKAKVKMRKDGKEKKNKKSGRSCFYVQLEKNAEICQCESTYLSIIFRPKKEIFSQNRTDATYKFYLEVKNGLTIPVNIKAVAAYPCITVNTKTLNFDKVFIGDCHEMCFILKNEGIVDCQWEICIENISKNLIKSAESPFYVHHKINTFSPNQEAIIKVYFKPFKNGNQKGNLIVTVYNGQVNEKINLFGYGVQRKLKINKSNIQFPPLVPGAKIEENLIIENNNEYAVELYWHHLDDFSESNRITRILKHYYKTNDILIPQRKVGETLPQVLFEFYDSLIHQMCSDDYFKSFVENVIQNMNHDDSLSGIFTSNQVKERISKHEIEKMDSSTMLTAFLNADPSEIETLLHAYIDKQQENPNFYDTMQDPLSELYNTAKKSIRTSSNAFDTSEPEKKLIIIFHGATYTEYQETACRTSKALNLPLLNLNQIFLESLALAHTESAKKLEELLDHRYKELVDKLEMLIKKDEFDTSNKILQLARKIPPPEELERMDRYSLYEHEMEMISSALESTNLLATKVKLRPKSRSSLDSTKRLSILPNVRQDLYRDILKERLSQPKFEQGYVLQTLNNDFIKSESTMLRTLLEATGKVALPLFITFHKSFDLYEQKVRESQTDAVSENLEKSKNIESTRSSKSEGARAKKSARNVKEILSTIHENEKDDAGNGRISDIPDSGKNLKLLKEYRISLNVMLETIIEWEKGRFSEQRHSIKTKDKLTFKNEFEVQSTDKFFILHIRANDTCDTQMYDATISYLSANLKAFTDTYSTEDKLPISRMESHTYTILKERETSKNSFLLNEIFSISPQNTLTIPVPIYQTPVTKERSSKLSIDLKRSKTWASSPAISLLEDIDSPELIPEARLSLQPRESRKFRVIFTPMEEGRFKGEFLLAFLDNPDVKFAINVDGMAQVPKLDLTATSVFDKVKNSKITESHEPTYFIDSLVYDFGSMLVLNKSNRSHKKYTQFKLKNISAVPAIVSCSLTDNKYDNFEINPRQIEIQPDEIGRIDITACATTLANITDNLILSIQHNDEPKAIQLQCNGIELKMEIEPKQIQLGRVLLRRTETQTVTIRNNSAVTIYWHLSIDATESQLLVTPTQGMIKYKQSCEIGVQYYANEVKSMETKFVSFDIFLSEKDFEPIATEVVTITAEIYDIIFEVEPSNEIYLKSIPVNSSSSASFTVKNLGLYEIKYEILFQKTEVLKKILDVNTIRTLAENFRIHPTAGSIVPKKQATINISYSPSIESTLKSVPLFKCVIIEPYKDTGIVDEHLLNVSAISYYTRFSIEPYPTLNFGTLGLKSMKTMQLNIKNIGEFPLKYSIVNQTMINRAQNGSAKKRESDKLSRKGRKSVQDKNAAKRSNSTQTSSVKWGPFYFEKSRGELEPEQVDTLAVRCSFDLVGHFEENLVIVVPDCLPVDENRQISLVADISIANIDFSNYSEMFAESYVLDSLNDFDCPNEFKEHTIFSKSTKTLHFCRVCVGSSYTTCITLRNTSLVHGDVTIEIVDESSPTDTFEINTNRLSIPPMTKQSFTIAFVPTVIGVFRSLLKMRLDLPQNLEAQIFSIALEGESYVPQIRVLDPSSENNDCSVINFGLSLVYKSCEKIVKIKNTGQVIAKFTIEVMDNPNLVYKLQFDKDEKSMLCGCSAEEYDKTKVNIQIIPEAIASVAVQFLPNKTEKYESRLKILIDHNPYDIPEVKLTGEGFDKPVILENLEIIHKSLVNAIQRTNSRDSTRKSRKSSLKQDPSLTRSNSSLLNEILRYNLDYGKCFLSQMYKINFKIVNKTADRYFRFEWTTHLNIVCTPLAGHLAPNDFKELTATFFSTEPMTLSQVPLNCAINEIIFDEPISGPSWDARQTRDFWTEKCPSLSFEEYSLVSNLCDEDDIYVRKETYKIKEPEHQIVPETLQSLQLLVSAIADFSDYQCDINTINFEDTLMFQHTEYKFALKNTGPVNLDFLWDITMDEQYPIRLDQAKLSTLSRASNLTIKERTYENSANLNNVLSSDNSQPKILRIQSDDTILSSGEPSDLFSSSAGLTDRSTDSWIEGENWPFQIVPEKGNLAPDESVECSLKFSPIDVFEYKAYLRCKMENLNPDKEPPKIVVTAKSLLPYCHFEVEENDYLTSGRRDMKLPGPPGYSLADPEIVNKIRVVEFRIMGIGQCHTRYIHMINPTNDVYTYRWSKLSSDLNEKHSIFQCSATTDVAEKGKRTKTSFTIIPEHIGIFESFWQFEIKKYNLKTLFLIVANVVEPSVSCRNILLKLETSAIGERKTASYTIINNECCPLSFCIEPDSLYSEGRFQVIKVCPMTGDLKPNSSQIFNVEYQPSLIGEYTFNVECRIDKLRKPIMVFITAEVVEILPKIMYIDTEDQEVDIFQNSDNIIDIGQLILHKPTQLKFKIANIGRLCFDYLWDVSTIEQDKFQLSITESEGRVNPNSHHICYANVVALEKVVIQGYLLSIKIKHGSTYRLKINASAKYPPLEYSFSHYDFGTCYIQTEDGVPYSADLIITNHQRTACSLTCDFECTPHIKVDLHELSQAIPPNSSIRIPIYFQPVEEMFYQEVLRFVDVNTSIQKDIVIKGEGISYRVGLKSPCDAIVNFGTVTVGKASNRNISLINEGRCEVKTQIVVIECYSKDKEKKNFFSSIPSSPSSSSTNTLNFTDFIEISPITLFNLKPNKERQVNIKFKAVQQIQSFKAKLGLKVDNSLFPLTIVKGNCARVSYYLNRTYISFGTVFEGCTVEEKLVLVNDGDIASRFKWNTDKLKPHFTITPTMGYCSAGSEIVFSCTFKPSCQSNCIQAEALLSLEGYENLTVNIAGNCCPLPKPTETLDFTAQIRQSEFKEIKIQNDSDQTWLIKPMIVGECFTATSTLSIEPKTIKLCNVTYKPQKETSEDKGKLVIILPDGRQPILYELLGHCTPAVTATKIIRQVPAKKKFIETLTVHNSSDRKCIFYCKTEVLHNTKSNPPMFQVPVLAKKQVYYEFPFYFEDEGRYAYKITFDDRRGCQQCYELEFTVTSPAIENVIELTTYVRSSIFHSLKIENPSESEESNFNASISNEDISIHGLPVALAPLAFKNVQIEYFPLLPCDAKTKLEIRSETLGSTFYELHLIAKPAIPEKPIYVKSSLGNSSNFKLKVKNYSKNACGFDIAVDNAAFTCPTTVNGPANEETIIDVRFEPYSLESINATIKATSSIAGEYTFPVTGLATVPQPQGPFVISSKSPGNINFKNVCLEAKVFEFTVDNEEFALNAAKTSIDSKKHFVITVKLKNESENTDKPKVGKLTITCADQTLPGVKWIYYLKAVLDK